MPPLFTRLKRSGGGEGSQHNEKKYLFGAQFCIKRKKYKASAKVSFYWFFGPNQIMRPASLPLEKFGEK